MRRPTILVLCSALAPAAVFFAGCLNSNSSVSPNDGGPAVDSSPVIVPVNTADGSVPGQGDDGGTPEASVPPVDTGLPPIDSGFDGGFPATNLTNATIDFGLVNCGAVPAVKTVTLQNTGTAALTYAVSLTAGTYFTLQGAASGTVAPGSSATLSLAPPTVPVTSVAGTPITDTLHVTTNIPGFTSIAVPVKLTPQGGSVAVSPVPASFGQVLVGDQAPNVPVTITNAGNAPFAIVVDAPANADFGFVYTGSGTDGGVLLAPDASLAGAAARFKPTVNTLESTTAAIATTGAMCASAESSVSINGTGTFASVTVTPGTLPFGTVACGAPAPAGQKVSIHNAYDYSINYSSVLKAGTASPYQLTNGSGSIAAGATAMITVTPKAITAPASVAAGAFNDTLTVTPVAAGVTPTAVALTESASGAILALTMASTAFGNVSVNTTGSLPFTVTNSGNLAAPLTLSETGSGFGGAFTSAASAAANNGTATGNATFAPPALGATSGSIKVTTTAAQCGPAPGALTLSATGVGPVATFPSTTVSFAVTCGSGAAAAQGVTISNATGTAALNLSNVKSVNGLFTIVSAPTTIAAGSSATIMIAAKAAVIGTALGGSSYTDTLSFTTNELGSPTHTVPVNVAVSGANLEFVDGSGTQFNGIITFTTCSPQFPFGVKNTGNMSATVTSSNPFGASSSMFNQTFVNGAVVAAGATATEDVGGRSNNNAVPCIGTDPYVFTEAASDPVCQPLPEVSGTQELQVTYNYDAASCHMGQCC